ncbi:hypothetical protein HNQ51_003042 [Inhella inkyongensis]|uniref:Nucleotidyltransferase family protein n=1 Tax=Inhella inkyongensis TaxID=392593 RepID=A0A840S5N8_9BURK|nr:nucleotidyltransferase family protein [Inhella inkyongensis]MBB5205715.1 hypothetical protein [Inhella inkyongensis]
MSALPLSFLLQHLAQPERVRALDETGWGRLIAQARAANLLGTLAQRMGDAGIHAAPAPERHLEGARQLAARQRLSVAWEAQLLQRTLGGLGVPVLLLKGAAYVLGNYPASEARMFGDIDILVSRTALGQVESTLMLAGWVSAKQEAYDQHYYREWMHELPPMVQVRRGTVLDVHHSLLPLTGRLHPRPEALIARARALPDLPGLSVPAPEDLVIHSLVHLAHEGEQHHGLRDLCDVDRLLRHFARTEPDFWIRLLQACAEHGVAEPVLLGLQLLQRSWQTPLPQDFVSALSERAGGPAPERLLRRFERAMHALQSAGALDRWAQWRLYVRAHALRMPPGMLLRHLTIKAWMGLRRESDSD